jgi:hypothetical protein
MLGLEGDLAIVNSGCWLRQLHPVTTVLRIPPVFVSRFVQTHVRVFRADGRLHVELWEHPRPAPRRLHVVERLAATGRLPAEPTERAPARIRAQIAL